MYVLGTTSLVSVRMHIGSKSLINCKEKKVSLIFSGCPDTCLNLFFELGKGAHMQHESEWQFYALVT